MLEGVQVSFMAIQPIDSSTHIKLSVVIPVRNEGAGLKTTTRILVASVDVPCEILIVYDIPEDSSVPEIEALRRAHPNVRGIHNTLGQGVINAIRTGVQAAVGDYVLIFVADEVEPVLAIEDMIALMNEGCDFVSCTRYAYGGRRLGSPLIRGTLSRLANWIFHFIAHSCFTDPTTGMKMFRRSVFERLQLETRSVGWAVAFEMAVRAQLEGLKLGEVPIISVDRLHGGRSTFRPGPWIKEYLRWFVWGGLRLRHSSSRQSSAVLLRIRSKTFTRCRVGNR
jgi:glycosyltransferase involved in cell wall biosynthesis